MILQRLSDRGWSTLTRAQRTPAAALALVVAFVEERGHFRRHRSTTAGDDHARVRPRGLPGSGRQARRRGGGEEDDRGSELDEAMDPHGSGLGKKETMAIPRNVWPRGIAGAGSLTIGSGSRRLYARQGHGYHSGARWSPFEASRPRGKWGRNGSPASP